MAGTPFVGEIRLVAYGLVPRGWAACNGQLLAISQNTALFSLLQTYFGGDGVTTFALPDLRGRAAMNYGTGPGLTPRNLGDKGGQEAVTLTVAQMGAHTHALGCHSTPGTSSSPIGNLWAISPIGVKNFATLPSPSATTMAAGAISPAGSGQPHNNMQSSLVMQYIIALQGIFPQRP